MVYLFFKLYLEFGWPDDYISDFLNINEMMQREFEDCLKFASALDYKLWIIITYHYILLISGSSILHSILDKGKFRSTKDGSYIFFCVEKTYH